MAALRAAPEWRIQHWFNVKAPLSVAALRGKVIFVTAFQMLCPGCVSHGLPQAMRARAAFDAGDLAVVGLHTVFEHHAAQGGRTPLAAFLHEQRIDFAVGVDAPADGGVPLTMRAYQMQGTPTTILIDRNGMLRMQKFGHLDDILLGASIQALIDESSDAGVSNAAATGCSADRCAAPPVAEK
ncbi:MAG: TlpA disulfide reductase family protein [Parvularculaceae bacterium]